MNRITAKEKAVNDGEIETRFVGKNLTLVGGIKLFHKFARKLGVEEALEQSINLPRRESKYKGGEDADIALVRPGFGSKSPFGHSSSPSR